MKLYEDKMKAIENDMTPFGIINTGLESESIVDTDGNLWSKENSRWSVDDVITTHVEDQIFINSMWQIKLVCSIYFVICNYK